MYESNKEGSVYHFQLYFLVIVLCFTFSSLTGVRAQISPDSSEIKSIAEILADKDGDGEFDYLDRKVTVSGRANVSSSVLHDRFLVIYLQNQSEGILVFSTSFEKPVRAGDSLIVTGKLDLYYGKPEIVVDHYEIIETESQIPTPVSLDETYQNPEEYLGMLVQGEAVISGNIQVGDDIKMSFAPSDTSDYSLSIYISESHTFFNDFKFDMLSVGDRIEIRGIMDRFSFENSGTVIYQVLPRNPDDIKYASIPKSYFNILLWGGLFLALIVIGWASTLKRQVRSKTKELSEALKDKELLMQEVNHRVKNNLAIVSGLIQLQLDSTDNWKAQQVLNDANSRIRSLTLIHDKLYKTEDFTYTRLDVYLEELIKTITDTFTVQNDSVKLNFELEPIQLNIDRVVPCGLLVNEIVVNAYKHAFLKDSQKNGKLSVKLKKVSDQVHLSIADNGPGLPENFQEKNTDSLGSMLIDTFASQIGADLEIKSESNGTTFVLRFPLDE